MKKQCATCEWFRPFYADEYDEVEGRCERYPPTALPNDKRAWPMVSENNRCGEWTAKENA